MSKRRHSYADAEYKNQIRNEAIPSGMFDSVVTMIGPDMKRNIIFFREKGYKNIVSYENHRETFLSQLEFLKKRVKDVTLCFGDIDNAPQGENTFFDYDYNDSIRNHLPAVEKARENFLFTFCVRNVGIESTIKDFLVARKENLVDNYCINRYEAVFVTSRGRYKTWSYRDNDHSPMLMILKYE